VLNSYLTLTQYFCHTIKLEKMLNSLHFFNPNTQQIYVLKTKKGIAGFLNFNLGKYMRFQINKVFNFLRILLVALAILVFAI